MKKTQTLEFIQDTKDDPMLIVVVLYPSARSILEEYSKGRKLYEKKGIVEGHMPDGTMWKWPIEEATTYIKKRGVWGFYRINDQEIHLWFRKNVKKKELQGVMAHEIGHWMPPKHRKMGNEEKKAEKYEFVALVAHDITNHLLDGVKKGMLK